MDKNALQRIAKMECLKKLPHMGYVVRVLTFLSFGCFMQWGGPVNVYALSVEEYCQVAENLLEISIQEVTERNAFGPYSEENQTAYLEHFDAIAHKFRKKRSQLFATYSTTSGEYLRYGAEHRQSVKAFFERNPDKKNTIDSLSYHLEGLRTQYESQVKHP